MRSSISRFRYRFTPHWGMCLLTFIFIALFVALGLWQLHRAEEKRLILAHETDLKQRAARSWQGEPLRPETFEHLEINGTFMPQVLLLDNQFYEHQLGYYVLSALDIGTDRVVLVDRGWVPAKATRKQLPEVTTPKAKLALSGRVYYPLGKSWVLGDGIEKKSGDYAVIESLDPELISQFLHKSVYPFIIRLDDEHVSGFVRVWASVSMPPARHVGYAFQWFSFAVVIFIIFIALNIRKYEKNN